MQNRSLIETQSGSQYVSIHDLAIPILSFGMPGASMIQELLNSEPDS